MIGTEEQDSNVEARGRRRTPSGRALFVLAATGAAGLAAPATAQATQAAPTADPASGAELSTEESPTAADALAEAPLPERSVATAPAEADAAPAGESLPATPAEPVRRPAADVADAMPDDATPDRMAAGPDREVTEADAGPEAAEQVEPETVRHQPIAQESPLDDQATEPVRDEGAQTKAPRQRLSPEHDPAPAETDPAETDPAETDAAETDADPVEADADPAETDADPVEADPSRAQTDPVPTDDAEPTQADPATTDAAAPAAEERIATTDQDADDPLDELVADLDALLTGAEDEADPEAAEAQRAGAEQARQAEEERRKAELVATIEAARERLAPDEQEVLGKALEELAKDDEDDEDDDSKLADALRELADEAEQKHQLTEPLRSDDAEETLAALAAESPKGVLELAKELECLLDRDDDKHARRALRKLIRLAIEQRRAEAAAGARLAVLELIRRSLDRPAAQMVVVADAAAQVAAEQAAAAKRRAARRARQINRLVRRLAREQAAANRTAAPARTRRGAQRRAARLRASRARNARRARRTARLIERAMKAQFEDAAEAAVATPATPTATPIVVPNPDAAGDAARALEEQLVAERAAEALRPRHPIAELVEGVLGLVSPEVHLRRAAERAGAQLALAELTRRRIAEAAKPGATTVVALPAAEDPAAAQAAAAKLRAARRAKQINRLVRRMAREQAAANRTATPARTRRGAQRRAARVRASRRRAAQRARRTARLIERAMKRQLDDAKPATETAPTPVSDPAKACLPPPPGLVGAMGSQVCRQIHGKALDRRLGTRS